MPSRIFLIGFMASGKTTLGRALAKARGMRFIDLDEEVEKMAGKGVSRIFADEGEEAFRCMEREALLAVLSLTDVVVACGGGTPANHPCMAMMKQRGLVVWLRASVDVTMRRLKLAPGQRPKVDALLGNDDELRTYIVELFGMRAAAYARAHAAFDSDRLENQPEIDEAVSRFERSFLTHI